MNNVIIVNSKEFDRKKDAFKKSKAQSVHVLSSFDKTLTKATFKGKKIISFIAKLRNGEYISKDYAKKAQELFNKYHPLEISNSIVQKEKNEKMREWWINHYNLLVECGLNKAVLDKIIKDMLADQDIVLREGVKDFLDLLNHKSIPLVIMSASGLGNVMMDFLGKYNLLNENITFVGNTLEFDKNGKFKGIKDNQIIHTFNKNETELHNLGIYKELIKRKNVILLCDSLADLNMINGFQYSNLIKIGFFNYSDEENIEDFKKNFDVVITNDGSFEFINELLEEIL